MERYLELKVTTSGKVGDILRAQAGLTKREISRAKFRCEGICRNGKQCRVTEDVVPGDVLRVCLENDDTDSKQLVAPNGETNAGKETSENLPFSRLSAPASPLPALQILYEDQDLLAVNKPAGLVTHPSGSHYADSLSNQIAAYFRDKGEPTRIRSIGRLDKETSGILLFARNQAVAARLQRQREEGKLQKTYLALVKGNFSEKKVLTKSQRLEAKDVSCQPAPESSWERLFLPLAPNPENPMKMTISPDGTLPGSKNAVTYFKTVRNYQNVSLVKLCLQTGRTHQIRVHMSGIGHPLLGDTLYNTDTVSDAGKDQQNKSETHFTRAALHAWRLTFYHPFTTEKMTLEAPLPDDFTLFLTENEEKNHDRNTENHK